MEKARVYGSERCHEIQEFKLTSNIPPITERRVTARHPRPHGRSLYLIRRWTSRFYYRLESDSGWYLPAIARDSMVVTVHEMRVTSRFLWHSGGWQKLQTLLFRILRQRRRRRIDTTPQSCNIYLGTVWHWSKRPAGWFDNLIFGNKFSRNYNGFLVARKRGLYYSGFVSGRLCKICEVLFCFPQYYVTLHEQ